MAAQSCRYFARHQCTGCTLLDVPYARQLTAKGELVRAHLGAALTADGGVLEPVAASPLPLGYRSSVKLCLQGDREGRTSVGLYLAGSKTVAHIPGCVAQAAEINALVARLMHPRVRRPAPFFNHRGRVFQRARLKFLTVRAAGRSTALILSHTGVERRALAAWLNAAGLGDVCAYESLLTARDGDLPIGRHTEPLSGPLTFAVPLAGRTFDLAPTAFFQANSSLCSELIAAATAFRERGDLLLDLYGGFGAYSFAAAGRMQAAVVVDGNPAAGDAARRAAAKSPPSPKTAAISAVTGTCEAYLRDQLTPDLRRRVTHVLVNPPRAGLSRNVAGELGVEALPALRELTYVSCNPETLARDLTVLRAQGLQLTDARPFDMFPQTAHVEVVARLRRRAANGSSGG